MPHRKVLNAQQQAELLSIPRERELLVTYYSLSQQELGWIRELHRDENRLGFAVQLALMKYPGVPLRSDWQPSVELIGFLAEQLGVPAVSYEIYGAREQTYLNHRATLLRLLGFRLYNSKTDELPALVSVEDLALRTDNGDTIARALIESLRKWQLLLPSLSQLEELAAAAIKKGEDSLYGILTSNLTAQQRHQLERRLLYQKKRGTYEITWLGRSVEAPSAANICEHLERLVLLREFKIPAALREKIHEERLTKIADIGSKSHIQQVRELKPLRRFATLVAIVLDFETRVLDEVLVLHAKMIGFMNNDAKCKHKEKLLADAEAMRETLLLLPRLYQILDRGRRTQEPPYEDIEKIIAWEDFRQLVEDIRDQTRNDRLGSLPFVLGSFSRIHRYVGALLSNVEFHGAPAVEDVLDAVAAVRRMDHEETSAESLPTHFVPSRWKPLVMRQDGIDRKYYELCAMSRLSECLRSGDIWVNHSRRFRDFEDYLLPKEKFQSIKAAGCLPLAIEPDCEKYLAKRLEAVASELRRVEELAAQDALEDVTITPSRLRIARHETLVPLEAHAFSRALYSLLPRVRITEVFQEVDSWLNFTRCFTDRRTGKEHEDKRLLHAALLARGLNLGFEKMAQACRDKAITPDRLQLADVFYARAEVFPSVFGMLLAAQKKVPISEHWGDGSTSSSDGQQFRTTRHAYDSGTFNPHYGSEPGKQAYTHVSDLALALYTTVITGSAEEALYVLDGLLYSDRGVYIKEHYTDTAGFSDHVFALSHIYGFRFAPWVRDFSDYALHLPEEMGQNLKTLRPMVGESLNIGAIRNNWDEILRLTTSIRHGTVRASEMMRKLASYPRQNGLAVALREFGRIERSLFMLQWISDPVFRRRVRRGLNKGEAVHALTRTVAAIGRAGEIRDRTVEQQIRRVNGFQLLVSVISVWNTVYLNRAYNELLSKGEIPDAKCLQHVAPLGHEHILLTGDYIWEDHAEMNPEGYRPLNRTGPV